MGDRTIASNVAWLVCLHAAFCALFSDSSNHVAYVVGSREVLSHGGGGVVDEHVVFGNEHSFGFHGGQVLATEIHAPLSGIRWQLGPRLVPHGHRVKASRASTQHEISPFARHVPCIFQVGVQQAKHHPVSLPWFLHRG